MACLFGDRVVQGFYDQGDVVSERERLTRGYCVRALQRSSCRELRGDECAKCMIEQECKATCYLNQEEKRIFLALEKQRVRPPSIRCVAPDSKEAKRVDVSIRIDDVVFPTNFTFSYHDPLHVLDITPRVSSCGGDFTLKLNESLKGVVSQAYVKFGGAGGVFEPSVTTLCVVSGTALKCSIPALKPGRHHVSVSTNAQQYTPSPISFVSHHTAHVYNIVPSRSYGGSDRNLSVSVYFFSLIPKVGSEGTRVVVDAHGIKGGHDYKCRFDGRVVPAVFNNSKLTCVAPHVTKKGPVEFSISLDGMHYSVGG